MNINKKNVKKSCMLSSELALPTRDVTPSKL